MNYLCISSYARDGVYADGNSNSSILSPEWTEGNFGLKSLGMLVADSGAGCTFEFMPMGFEVPELKE